MNKLEDSVVFQVQTMQLMGSLCVAMQQAQEEKRGKGERCTLAEMARLQRLRHLENVIASCVAIEMKILNCMNDLEEDMPNMVTNDLQQAADKNNQVRK